MFWFHGLVIRVWEYLAFGLWVCSILEFRGSVFRALEMGFGVHGFLFGSSGHNGWGRFSERATPSTIPRIVLEYSFDHD